MINRTFSTMVSNVGSNIQDTSSAMATNIKRFINNAYFDVIRRINWNMIDESYSVSVTTQDIVLPDNFGKVLKVWDGTNKCEITATSIEEQVQDNLALIDQTGTVTQYVILNRPVMVQPSSASVVDMESSSSADTTQVVLVRGTADGREQVESVTLTGGSTASTTLSFSKITSISKNSVTTGIITVAMGATTIASFSPEMLDYKVKVMRFYATPSSAITINIPYYIRPMPMVNDTDVPLFDCADILEEGATSMAWQYKRQYAKARVHAVGFERGITQLTWDEVNNPDEAHVFRTVPYSREIA